MLTDLLIKKLTIPEKRREIPDGKISGLYLVVQPSGARSWALRYRHAGIPKKLTIGAYPSVDLATARKRAQEAIGDVAAGKDPAGLKATSRAAARAEQSTKDRMSDVAAIFLERSVKRSAGALWAKETARLLRVEILPTLGSKRIGDVRRADIHAMLDGIVDRGSGYTANRSLAVLKRMFNWSIERGIVDLSPVDKVKAPAAETSRDRVLTDDEICLVWKACERIGAPFGDVVRLLLLTGCRRDEIAEGRWNEIDLDAKTWTIGKERSKNGVAHEIPLSDKAVEIITGLGRIEGKGFVFTTTGKTPVSGFSRAKGAVDKAIHEIQKEEAEARGDDPDKIEAPAAWVLHDLRRTVATNLQKLGVRLEVTEAVLNHVSGSRKGIVGVYQKYDYASEKRAALDAWARRLEAIVTGAPAANVIELAAARG